MSQNEHFLPCSYILKCKTANGCLCGENMELPNVLEIPIMLTQYTHKTWLFHFCSNKSPVATVSFPLLPSMQDLGDREFSSLCDSARHNRYWFFFSILWHTFYGLYARELKTSYYWWKDSEAYKLPVSIDSSHLKKEMTEFFEIVLLLVLIAFQGRSVIWIGDFLKTKESLLQPTLWEKRFFFQISFKSWKI